MNPAALLALHDKHERLEAEARGMRREVAPPVVRLVNGIPHGEGAVIHSRLDAGNADRVIAEQIAYFQSIGQAFEWKTFGHDTPPDLHARLLAAGFEAEEPESFLVLDVEEAPAELLRPVTSDVRRITDPAGLSAIERIQLSVWGEADPTYLEALRDEMIHEPAHISIFIAYEGGVPASYGRISYHDHSPFAGLWGGSTIAEYRGRGLYTSLLAVRLQEARTRGVRFLTIDASPMSRPIVEKHGFKYLTTTQPFKWHLPKTGAHP